MSTTEFLDAIDENNNVIGKVNKEDAYKYQISHRIVHVMVISKNKVFIPRRSTKVSYLPGHYCSSAGGHVRSGESSEEGALRELQEEIGLGGPLQCVRDFFYRHDFWVHLSIYLKFYDQRTDRIQINPEEVMSGDFLSLEEIGSLDKSKIHPQLYQCINEIRRFL